MKSVKDLKTGIGVESREAALSAEAELGRDRA